MSCQNRRSLALLLLILSLFVFPSFLPAMMVGLSTEELSNRSERVVVGTVESKESFWSSDGSTIITSVVVTVEDAIKGEHPGEPLVIQYEGGEIGNIGMKVSDTPSFQEGERVLLFLETPDGQAAPLTAMNAGSQKTYKIVGKGQGKYSISPDRIARKKGFSIADGAKKIDKDIQLDALIQKIRKGSN